MGMSPLFVLWQLVDGGAQAEKTTFQLRRHHPELKDIWGDLEAAIPVVTPIKAEQPTYVKLNLLPFQLESRLQPSASHTSVACSETAGSTSQATEHPKLFLPGPLGDIETVQGWRFDRLR